MARSRRRERLTKDKTVARWAPGIISFNSLVTKGWRVNPIPVTIIIEAIARGKDLVMAITRKKMAGRMAVTESNLREENIFSNLG